MSSSNVDEWFESLINDFGQDARVAARVIPYLKEQASLKGIEQR